jgi:serine/threonine-protein kinase
MDPETQIIFEQLLLDRELVSLKHLARAKRHQVKARAEGKTVALLELLLEQQMGDPQKLREAARIARQRSGVERVTIDGFELMEQVGRGGMGAVYRAIQINMGRTVALKLMRPRLARDSRYLERFLREARACAQLSHPNIVQAIDAGRDKGYYYFAMEFVDGDSLRRLIARDGRLPEERCVRIAIEIARALDHAARFGLVHRDVKPENILVERTTGTAKLADLGLVKTEQKQDSSVTQMGTAVGTPNYISPEQARGEADVDVRSDIYSLGAALYFAVTGTLPFTADTAPVLMSKHISEPLDPPHQRCPDVSRELSQVIQKMMAKKPDARYQTGAELLADLERLARGERPLAAAAPRPKRARHVRASAARRRTARTPASLAALAVVAVVVLGGLAAALAVALSSSGRGEKPTTDPAERHFRVAAALIRRDPTRFEDVTDSLRHCIRAAPDGPRAATARRLFQVTQRFRDLRKAAARTPEDFADVDTQLRELAAESPPEPSYAPAIHQYRRDLARRILGRVVRKAVEDPTRVPGGLRWVDTIAQSAPADAVRAKAAETRQRLQKILAGNADYILDRLQPAIERHVAEDRFGDAIRVLRSGVPESLMTPTLQSLIERRVGALREQARQHVESVRKDVWQLLDQQAVERALDRARHLVERLGVPELADEARSVLATAEAAPKLCTALAGVAKRAEAEPADPKAVGRAALEVRKTYGKDPYVASRLEAYKSEMQLATGERRVDDMIDRARTLLDGGKAAEADELLRKALAHEAATDAQRQRVIRLRVQLGPRPALTAMLREALGPKLPLQDVAVRLHGEREPVTVTITGSTAEALSYTLDGGEGSVPWARLPVAALADLARGSAGLIDQDDANGLYCLGALCHGTDNAAARKYLEAAAALAEARTAKELPERSLILRSTKLLLAELRRAEAEAALQALATKVGDAARGTRQLDEAIAAWAAFDKEHGAGPYVKARADAYAKLRKTLAEAVYTVRTGQVLPYLKAFQWDRVVPRLEQTITETDRIHPLDEERRETLGALVDFGRRYVVEKRMFDAAFSVRPWREEELAALADHKEKAVAERARRYREIFKHKVEEQETVAEQLEFARREQQGEVRVPVRDVTERLARYNAVFAYWRRRDGSEVAMAEIRAADDFRRTGEGGNIMALLIMEDFLKDRRATSKEMRAEAELSRVESLVRAAGPARPLCLLAIDRARALMKATAGVGDYPARFCLFVAEQSERLGNADDARAHYERLIDPRSRHRHYAWQGYLGRGRLREADDKTRQALLDYEKALKSSQHWHEAHRCAEHIVNLCVRSGKLDNRAAAERAVSFAADKATHPSHVTRTRGLLK